MCQGLGDEPVDIGVNELLELSDKGAREAPLVEVEAHAQAIADGRRTDEEAAADARLAHRHGHIVSAHFDRPSLVAVVVDHGAHVAEGEQVRAAVEVALVFEGAHELVDVGVGEVLVAAETRVQRRRLLVNTTPHVGGDERLARANVLALDVLEAGARNRALHHCAVDAHLRGTQAELLA